VGADRRCVVPLHVLSPLGATGAILHAVRPLLRTSAHTTALPGGSARGGRRDAPLDRDHRDARTLPRGRLGAGPGTTPGRATIRTHPAADAGGQQQVERRP